MNTDRILIRQARVIDPGSDYHQQVCDILIEEDRIARIAEHIDEDQVKVISRPNLHISPGWFDLRVNFHDPGHEEREDIETGMQAAIAGGFTAVGLSPDTDPVIDSKADIEYVYQRAADFPVDVYPFGSISKGMRGEELSEMYDMHQAGAVGFSHGKKPVTNAALLKLALQYARPFAPPLHLMPLEKSLSEKGQMHEGAESAYLGLKGIPEIAEEIALLRDLHLAEYAEAAVHFMSISSEKAVQLLRQAQGDKHRFTADVAVANLLFTDKELAEYDTNYKVLPPLRAEADRQALIRAIKDGVISVITSDHLPVDVENKKCEFDQADFGMIGLQTLFGALGSLSEELSLEEIINAIAINPRKVLQLEVPSIKEDSWAEFTLFDPNEEWSLEKNMIESRSHNSPFIGKKLKGRPLGIINNGMLVWLAGEL